MTLRCYHCDAPISDDNHLRVRVAGRERDLCCPGCAAVAQLIDAQGLSRFYAFRSSPAMRPDDRSDRAFEACDRPEVVKRIVESRDGGRTSVLRCRIDGLTCAACTWLINKALRDTGGIVDVSVNPLTAEAEIAFETQRVQPSEVLGGIARFGFRVRPLLHGAPGQGSAADGADIRRLAVAGLGFAQVMSLSAALYLGAFKSMAASFESFLTLASMLIATPVVLYAGQPIFRNALADLLRRQISMDLPVGIAIAAALGASIVNALRGSGPVYFDTATMFVFFLTFGRFLEARARLRAGRIYQAYDELLPVSCIRASDGAAIGTIELVPGDHVLVPPGEAAPADGTIVSAAASVDESLLSGETTTRLRHCGEPMLGGSLNVGAQPIELRVTAVGRESYAGRVGQLLEAALAGRPAGMRTAEIWAARLASALLVTAAIAACVWLAIAPERAFDVVLAMLVVTCPCAVSLAAPAAFAAGLGALARQGLLLRSTEVIERLLDVRHWLFDKTGTVTEGAVRIAETRTFAELDAARCLEIAAALEAGIEHPLATAFRRHAGTLRAHDVEYVQGRGVSGTIDAHIYRLGSAEFVGAAAHAGDADIRLTRDGRVIAGFAVRDRVRADARAALQALVGTGASVALVSGDGEAAVRSAAAALGIETYFAGQRPEDKLEVLRSLQSAGRRVAVVGDGVNDAPFLAAADVSIAMVAGSRLARASADVVFTGGDLGLVAKLPTWARQIRRTIRQNIAWAIAWNLLAVPLAAGGLIPPWLAALGMSVSSLIVVLNGLRLGGTLRAAEIASQPGRHTTTGLAVEPS